MKKTILSMALALMLGLGATAQNGGGLFQRGSMPDEDYYEDGYYRTGGGGLINLPDSHGNPGDANAPLGSGIVVLVSLGAAYLVGKKREKE